MTFQTPNDVPYLYLFEEDLFRIGNASTAKLDNVREDDVDTYEVNRVQIVIANGKGISLFSEQGLSRARRGGWLWKIPRGTPMPSGLALHNDHGSHFMICPLRDMPMFQFKGLLCEIAKYCAPLRKV